jgi:hypothetical protein
MHLTRRVHSPQRERISVPCGRQRGTVLNWGNSMLRKLTTAVLIGTVALTASLPTTASAFYYPKPPVIIPTKPIATPGTSGAAGAAAVGGFIGFVAILAGYDLLRRTTCIGDPWGLGGLGFYTPITPASGNVMIPAHQRGLCAPKRVAVVKARG